MVFQKNLHHTYFRKYCYQIFLCKKNLSDIIKVNQPSSKENLYWKHQARVRDAHTEFFILEKEMNLHTKSIYCNILISRVTRAARWRLYRLLAELSCLPAAWRHRLRGGCTDFRYPGGETVVTDLLKLSVTVRKVQRKRIKSRKINQINYRLFLRLFIKLSHVIFEFSDSSPGRHVINCPFPKRVTKKRLNTAKVRVFWSDQREILINCILKYSWRFTACIKKQQKKQPLGESQSWQETLTCLLLLDVRVPDAVVAVPVQFQQVAVPQRMRVIALKNNNK